MRFGRGVAELRFHFIHKFAEVAAASPRPRADGEAQIDRTPGRARLVVYCEMFFEALEHHGSARRDRIDREDSELRWAEPRDEIAAAATPGEQRRDVAQRVISRAWAEAVAQRVQIFKQRADQHHRFAGAPRLFHAARAERLQTFARVEASHRIAQQVGETLECVSFERDAQNAAERARIHEAFEDVVHCAFAEALRGELFLRRIGEHHERDAGCRAMHEMHGVERIAHAQFEVEQNNFGVDEFYGRHQRGHRRNDGEVEAAGCFGE